MIEERSTKAMEDDREIFLESVGRTGSWERSTKTMEDEWEIFPGSVGRREWWELDVMLHAAVHIDLPLPVHKDLKTLPSYYVCARVDDRVLTTMKRNWSGWATVYWNEALTMEVGGPPSESFLHLELVRVGAFQDPGSSNGQTVVGRAIVPLMPVKGLSVPLIKTLGGHGGVLFLSLNLQRRLAWPNFVLLP